MQRESLTKRLTKRWAFFMDNIMSGMRTGTRIAVAGGVLSALAIAAAAWFNAGSAAPLSRKPAAPAVKAVAAGPAVKESDAPNWSELSLAQQHALQPLNASWDKLDAVNRQKWLKIADRFALMGTKQQQRAQKRMQGWIKLTPEQRRLAREDYLRASKLEIAERSEQWQRYQQLPEARKKRFAALTPFESVANLPNLPKLPAEAVEDSSAGPTAPSYAAPKTGSPLQESAQTISASAPELDAPAASQQAQPSDGP